jgi:DNA-binding transcriptional LysR family regulator
LLASYQDQKGIGCMDLRHLRYFLAVIEESHFGRAARRVHVSQPPLSRQIKELEDELGVQLLNRTSRRVEPTEAGRAFANECRQILEQVEHAMIVATEAARGSHNRLIVGYTPHTADIVTRTAGEFAARHAPNRVFVKALSTTRQLDALRQGQIDVGFLTLPVESRGLSLAIIRRSRLILAMPENHPLSSRRRIHLRELAKEPLIVIPAHRNPRRHRTVMEMCRNAGFIPRNMHETDDVHVTLELVRRGLGIAIMRATIGRMHSSGVVFRTLQHSPILETAIAYKKGDQRDNVHAFVAIAKQRARKESRSRIT